MTFTIPQKARWMALVFPQLAIDRLRRERKTPPEDRPFALFAKAGNAFCLVAVCPQAAQAGLHAGQALADARAILPRLAAIPADPDADAALLDQIAAWADRFTPVVVLDPPNGLQPGGLLLEIAGSLHLFGGEATLMAKAVRNLEAQGLLVRAAMAPAPAAALALAHFAPGATPGEDNLASTLAPLPVEALRLPRARIALLKRLGLYSLASLLDAPRQPLAARLGTETLTALDRITGRAGEALSPRRPLPPVFARGRFVEPITTLDAVLVAADTLTRELAARLDRRGAGVRRLRLALYGVDGRIAEARLGLSRPERDPSALLRLLRERLGRDAAAYEAAFGFEAARLDALEIAPIVLRPAELEASFAGNARPDKEAEARLVDTLTARLGSGRALRLALGNTHLPERAGRFLPAEDGLPRPSQLKPGPPAEDGVMRRPLVLFDPPQQIKAMAGTPDGPPVRFRWRRLLHEVVRAEGPERIVPDWLSARLGAREDRLRDYYRIEDAAGRRYWLYREGGYGGAEPPRWFVHGAFA